MNKGDFVGQVADASGLSKTEAERAVEAMFQVVKKALKAGESISLVGFGTFVVRSRAARTGRNPRTGDSIEISASKVPAFKAGKALKDALA
jgi:DNA-binding protein HU-beta